MAVFDVGDERAGAGSTATYFLDLNRSYRKRPLFHRWELSALHASYKGLREVQANAAVFDMSRKPDG